MKIVKEIRTILRGVRPLPDLSIRQLEYLVAVAESPSWAVAAERVGVSPSALSQGLEDEFLLQADARTENTHVYRPVFITATSKT